MDDPVKDITPIIHRLTQGSPQQQADTINYYFTENASFTHPFCRTGSFEGSRYLIHNIFQWYKIMSPQIDLTVNSVAFDEQHFILYVNISQIFSIWFIPFHRSPVTLTTQLQLVRRPAEPRKYYIQSQNDLYQVDQFVKFFAPWNIGTTIVILWHFWATFFCVVGAQLGRPFTAYLQRKSGRQEQAWEKELNGRSSLREIRNLDARTLKS
ncbi:hypothetical protein AC578_8623 [Pseudocercospora eumusae]|uniref:SigF-like NTF2-like domain-containing protein n=1 Tax=Pseudocercospora eumusae TaxID=321146 RepID=A0A139HQ57_9PEZI|nr:hypothetical protein AC578_8623 [Pseudocercospora eumusae]KXT04520.1 hypothetical protein AC578_8623 [Pseudocercospora eumusae]